MSLLQQLSPAVVPAVGIACARELPGELLGRETAREKAALLCRQAVCVLVFLIKQMLFLHVFTANRVQVCESGSLQDLWTVQRSKRRVVRVALREGIRAEL